MRAVQLKNLLLPLLLFTYPCPYRKGVRVVMANIWITEDDANIGLLLRDIAERMGHSPLWIEDAAELEKQLRQGVPDLLLLDLMLRGKNGFEVLSEWKKNPLTRDIPVIIISARSAESDKVRGLGLGAEDYITKPFGLRELRARIDTALRRVRLQAQPITLGHLDILPGVREVKANGKTIPLTHQEFELLLCLARHSGSAVSRAELLREAWGYQLEGDATRTVDFHIRELRVKLDCGEERDGARIETVRGFGYRLSARSAQ